VLLGGPGSGKSSLLRNLAVASARAEDAGPAIPGWNVGPLVLIYTSLCGLRGLAVPPR